MKDIQLSATQRAILTAAAEREDGSVFPLTTELKGGAVGIVLGSLASRGLVEGEGEDLQLTPAAYEALGAEPPVQGGLAEADQEMPAADAGTGRKPRPGTKQAMLIDMLSRPEGATVAEIAEATGWQPHTVRGAIAGALKKRLGLTIASEKVDGRGRVYRAAA